VIFPAASGVASALGLLTAEPRTTFARSRLTPVDEDFPAVAREELAQLVAEAERTFAAEAARGRRVRMEPAVSVRFVGQGYDIPVALSFDESRDPSAATVLERFHDAYERLYARSHRDEPVEVTTWRLSAILEAPPVDLAASRPEHPGARPPFGRRRMYDVVTAGFVEAAIVPYDDLAAGEVVDGPAVIEQAESTGVLFSGDRASVDGHGNIIVTLGGGSP
jgi:N-methylhydantoinase A/oxoprolinase/acetone carboxylase beta subunit